jgi:tyrosyl-DNA phosphodiesterase-1
MIIAAKPPARGAARRKNAHDSDTDGSDVELVEPAAPAHGWAYVGSHNFTPSAWGTLSGSAFNPVLNARRFRRPAPAAPR